MQAHRAPERPDGQQQRQSRKQFHCVRAIESTRQIGWFHAKRPLGPFMTAGMANNDTGRDLKSKANGAELGRWSSIRGNGADMCGTYMWAMDV